MRRGALYAVAGGIAAALLATLLKAATDQLFNQGVLRIVTRGEAYGLLLGLIYPIMRARRPVRVLPHTPEEIAPGAALSA